MNIFCNNVIDCLSCLKAAEGWLTVVRLQRYRQHDDACGCDVCTALYRMRNILEWIKRDPAQFQLDAAAPAAQQAPGPARPPDQAAGTGTGYAS